MIQKELLRGCSLTYEPGAIECSEDEFDLTIEAMTQNHMVFHRDQEHVPRIVSDCIEYASASFIEYEFTEAIVDFYESSDKGEGWRGGDDKLPGSPVLVFSFGKTRLFSVKPKDHSVSIYCEKEPPFLVWEKEGSVSHVRLNLGHADLVIMSGRDFQSKLKHHLAPSKKRAKEGEEDRHISVRVRAMARREYEDEEECYILEETDY